MILRRPGYYLANPDGTMDFAVLNIELDADVLTEMETITKVLFEIEPIVNAYEISAYNHQELHEKLSENHASLSNLMNRRMGPHSNLFDCLTTSAQKLTNFLSSVSAFLDHTAALIHRAYGENSLEAAAWHHKRKSLHSERFSYRFLYELRNFSQHISIPLSSLNIVGKRETLAEPMTFDITLLVVRDRLLTEKFNWKMVRHEIEAQPERFDLLPLVDEHFESIQQLCFDAIAFQSSRLQECVHYLQTWLRLLKLPANAIPTIFVGESDSPDTPPGNFEYIPVEQLTRIHQIYQELGNQLGHQTLTSN